MRYEAKHQYFNQLAKTMGNYLNLCHSLAMRHQCLQAYVLTSGSIVLFFCFFSLGSVIKYEKSDQKADSGEIYR